MRGHPARPRRQLRPFLGPFHAVAVGGSRLGHASIRPRGGRSRPHLSLREGSEQPPTSWFFPGGGRGAGLIVGRGELFSSLRPRCSRPADATNTH